MTTDLVEKCARAAFEADTRGKYERYDPFEAQPKIVKDRFNKLALAVIDALADGVSDEMVRAGDEAFTGLLIPVDSELKAFLAAAIRAAKSREG